MAKNFNPKVFILPLDSNKVKLSSLATTFVVNSLFIGEIAEFCTFATTPTVKINVR